MTTVVIDRLRKTLLMAPMVVLLSACVVHAANSLYVTPSGAGSKDGSTWDNAFDSIQNAINAATGAGDVIYLKSGNYPVTAQVDLVTRTSLLISGGYIGSGAPGTLSGANSIIYRSANNVRVMNVNGATNCTLERLTFANGHLYGSPSTGAGINIGASSNLLLSSCVITNNSMDYWDRYADFKGAGLYSAGSVVAVSNCLVAFNSASYGNIFANAYGGGVYLDSGTMDAFGTEIRGNVAKCGGASTVRGGGVCQAAGRLWFRNCIIAGNDVSDATVYGDGVDVINGTCSLEQCTVVANGGIGVQREAGILTATNSILWANGDDVAGTVTLGYCDVEDGDSAGANGCISTNPVFERGLYLASGSLCFDAGTGVASAYGVNGLVTRADGTADSGTVDMGYHYPAGINAGFADLYVAGSGSDTTGDGLSGTPWRSISKALSVARTGTRIHIGAGSYTNLVEAFPLVVNLNGIQLLGAGSASSVINAANSSTRGMNVIASCGDTRIEGVSIINAYIGSGGWNGGGLYAWGSQAVFSDVSVTNNIIWYWDRYGTLRGGGVYSEVSYLTFTNCIVRGNYLSNQAFQDYRGAGVAVIGGVTDFRSSAIELNVITTGTASTEKGAGLYYDGGAHRLFNCLVRQNNDVINHQGDGICVMSGSLSVENTTLYSNNGEGVRREGGTVAVTNSILWGNGDDVVGTVTLAYSDIEDGDNNGSGGCISSSPLFDSGIYLGNGSPCIDTGTGMAVGLGLSALSTWLSGALDSGTVDMGYHSVPGSGLGPTDLYIAGTGSDTTGNGTSGSPWRSITKALQSAGLATKIHIASGQYDNMVETFPLGIPADGVQLLGSGAATSVINPKNSNKRAITISGRAGVRIENLSLINANVPVDGYQGGAIYLNGAGATIAGCIITNNVISSSARYCSGYGAGIYANASSLVVSNCTIKFNAITLGDIWNTGYGGGLCIDSGDTVIRDSIISRNAAIAYEYSCGGGLYAAGQVQILTTLVSSNKSVSTLGTTSYGDGIYVASGPVSMMNVTVADNEGCGVWRAAGATVMSNSIAWGNGVDVTGTVTMTWSDVAVIDPAVTMNNCISANPLFVNAIAGDYHEKSIIGSWHNDVQAFVGDLVHSPCIDAGDPGSSFALEPGPDGGCVNMGAYGNTIYASKSSSEPGTRVVFE